LIPRKGDIWKPKPPNHNLYLNLKDWGHVGTRQGSWVEKKATGNLLGPNVKQ